jgi:hypothetical protein
VFISSTPLGRGIAPTGGDPEDLCQGLDQAAGGPAQLVGHEIHVVVDHRPRETQHDGGGFEAPPAIGRSWLVGHSRAELEHDASYVRASDIPVTSLSPSPSALHALLTALRNGTRASLEA